jgi:hypothetical protein
MNSPSTAQVLNDNGKRARQDEIESPECEVMASTEDEENPENDTEHGTLLLASPHTPRPEDEEEPENETGDTTLLLASRHTPIPEDHGLELSSEITTHEPTSSHMQPTHRNHLTFERRLHFITPESSLPPWKYISPRETNPAARLPSAMAHRAHTPLPAPPLSREGTPLPDTTPNMLTSHSHHGKTTYTSESTEQLPLNPNDPGDAEILAYTDKFPMAGAYMFSAEHNKTKRQQVAMAMAYQQEEVLHADLVCKGEKRSRRVPGR